MDALSIADELLSFQHQLSLTEPCLNRLSKLMQAPMLILPAASRGHAMCFVRFKNWWAKIDRGENSLKEGSVNIYHMTHPENFTIQFLQNFLYKKQSRLYFHKVINQQLGLIPMVNMPINQQITGNCSWANVQAVVPVAYALLHLQKVENFSPDEAIHVYNEWVEWDKDRALDECIQRFYPADKARKASFASMLAAVLFQSCDDSNIQHVTRAEKILAILTLPDYYYILKTYLDTYCLKRLTHKGNNLLKLLDDCGFNPNIGVNPIATGLNNTEKR
jgi:hypothetical protein